VTPNFLWEQTADQVVIHAEIKGFKAEAIDIFISDLFVKINAHPTYLLALDLLHPIVVEKSTYQVRPPHVTLTLKKADAGAAFSSSSSPSAVDSSTTTPSTGSVWDTLCIDKKTPLQEVKKRRDEALHRAEALYNTKLQTREQQKEIEKKRMFNEHWEIEKQQRRDIEQKVAAERDAEASSLGKWQDSLSRAPSSSDTADAAAALEKHHLAALKTMTSPADIFSAFEKAPAVRTASAGGETVTVKIDFTPKSLTVPSRTRGDEDFYRKSRYKPVSIEDSPMFWKEKGDTLYRSRNWKQAADAYSESIKRDGCFLTCVSNRASCWIRLHEYKRAVEDCDLALTILSNTPASETTQDRYRHQLTKLHARRGAAYAWNGEYTRALEDLRLAHAYRNHAEDHDIAIDLQALENFMKEQGLVESADPVHAAMHAAGQLYYNGNYSSAVEAYRAILALDPYAVKARSNLSATLLQMGAFQDALEESEKIISFCGEVAAALAQPGVTSSSMVDSDDEEEDEDEMVSKRNAAAKRISEKSGHVYLLLKAYVRCAAAHCGLKQFRKALELMESAVRITPYDDDLRDDANRLAEKIRFETLVSATASGQVAAPPQ